MILKYILPFFIGITLLTASPAWCEPNIQISVYPGNLYIFPTGDLPQSGANKAEITGAKNETESFQIVVTARDGNLHRVNAEITTLRNEKSGEIASDYCVLYREVYVPVRYSSPKAALPPGWYPDPLIPFKDPYTGKPVLEARWEDEKIVGSKYGGTDFDVFAGCRQTIWVDITIPENVPAGEYIGELHVQARNAKPIVVPVRLTVWDFTLPPGPTHENHFGDFSGVAGYSNLQRNSPEFYRLEDRYSEMLAAHRINPILPSRFRPKTAEDGSIQMDDALDQQITEFVQRLHVTNIDIPHAPFRDVLGANREKAIHFYRSWYAYLDKKGWAKGAYLYMLDEPNDAEAYEQVRKLGALVKEAEPRIRRLVVEQPYTEDNSWGTLDGSIDIWCPLFGFIDEVSVKRVQVQGDEVWSYTALVQTAPGYHPDYEKVKRDNPPFWEMDFPLISYRIAPWLNRRYGVTGLLYWQTAFWRAPNRNPWEDPGFRLNFNGEGFLFYPGKEVGIEGPIATTRLKNLRDGMEDYEYFVLLEQCGGKELVDQIAREVVPTWGSWNSDPYKLLELRRRLAEAIVKKKK